MPVTIPLPISIWLYIPDHVHTTSLFNFSATIEFDLKFEEYLA